MGRGNEQPDWWAALAEEDRQFVRRFVLASGSLKAMAAEYGVSYPTVRSRLDRLIELIRLAESPEPGDPWERKIRLLVAQGRLSPSVARELMSLSRKTR